MVESRSKVIGASPGPAPAAHARVSAASASRSSWRTCPNVNDRKNVPSVDGAITRCPTTAPVDPDRNTSASSMQFPPRTRLWINVMTFRPGR